MKKLSFLLALSTTMIAMNSFASSAPRQCEIRAIGSGLAVFADGQRISDVWNGVPEFAFISLEKLQNNGYCASSAPRQCEIRAIGDGGLAVFADGQRISDVWNGVPEFAFISLEKLQNNGYCK